MKPTLLITGFLLLNSVAIESFATEANTDMEYVDICNPNGDCKKFSRLVMGTDHLIQGDWTGAGQPEMSEEQAFSVLDEAAKHGINFFDTSPIYVGNIENRLGKWKRMRSSLVLKDDFYNDPSLNPDRKLYILSKGGFPFDLYWAKRLENGSHSDELKSELIKQNILNPNDSQSESGAPLKNVPAGTYASRLFGDESQITERIAEELGHTMNNLNNDITIYLMHRDDGDTVGFKDIKRSQTEVKTIMQALGADEVASRFWMLGWSNWKTDRINESIKLSQSDVNLPKPMINSPYFSFFEMSERSIHAIGIQVTHEEMMNPNFQKGIKIMPYSPLGGFSILDKPEPKWENAKKAAKEKFEQGDPYWQNVYHSLFTSANEARWYRVVDFTKKFNTKNKTSYTVDQMMNAYVLAHPRTDFLAIGPINKEQTRRTVKSLQLSKMLTTNDLEYLYSGSR